MIRALLKKQLLELGAAFVRSSKTGKQRSRVGTFGYTLLFAALMLLVMLSFGSMALPLAVTLVPQGLDWLYFVLMELSALTVSVLASAFTSYGHLFRCRDNQQLLALPIPPGTIFAVRCGGVYLTGLIYLLLAWVPRWSAMRWRHPAPAELAGGAAGSTGAGGGLYGAGCSAGLDGGAAQPPRPAQKPCHCGGYAALSGGLLCGIPMGGQRGGGPCGGCRTGGRSSRSCRRAAASAGSGGSGNVPALLLLLALAAACMALCGKVLAKPYLRLLTLEPGRAKAEYRAKTQKSSPRVGHCCGGNCCIWALAPCGCSTVH
mgnify:CR=1 FL=1